MAAQVHESTEMTDFGLFGNVSVNICVRPRGSETKNADYAWRSPESCHKEFIILLDDIAELIISIDEVKTFVRGQMVDNRKNASDFGRKRIVVMI